MIIDLVLAGIGVGSLVALVLVVGRKLPIVSQIDTASIPENRQNQIKHELMERRLERRLQDVFNKIAKYLTPVGLALRDLGHRSQRKLSALEKRYRSQLAAGKRRPDRLEIAPKLQALETEARQLFEDESYSEAEKKCIEMIALDHASVPAYRLLGEVYVATKSYKEAREVYRFLLKLNKQDDDALAHLGTIASQQGNLAEAKEDLIGALAINKEAASNHLQLCEIYRELGEYTNAVHECQEAVRLEPNNPKMIDALLDVALLAKDKPTAWSALDQLKSVNPENQKLSDLEAKVAALDKMR
jgi:tetratricopeptide (TPR) repeat protein